LSWSVTIGGSSVKAQIVSIMDELNGHREAIIRIKNNSSNRSLVSSNQTVEISWDGTLVFKGKLVGVEYYRSLLECKIYDSCYEQMQRRIITASYDDASYSTILSDICTAAGVTAGSAPSDSASLRFDKTNCLEAGKYLAKVGGYDFWSDFDASDNPRFNIGTRGTSRGSVTVLSVARRGIDRSKARNKVIVIGVDNDGNRVEVSAGTGSDVYVTRVEGTKASDEATLQKLANALLNKLNTTASGAKISLKISEAYNFDPGDTVTISAPELNLDGTYKIYRITKKMNIAEAEVDQAEKLLEQYLEETKNYEDFGIYPISVTQIPIPSGDSFPSNPVSGQLFFRSDVGKLYRYNAADDKWELVVQTNSGTSFPAYATKGELFYRSDRGLLYRCREDVCSTAADWDVVVRLSRSGLDSDKGTGNTVGEWYYATDTLTLYRWDGSSWTAVLRGVRSVTSVSDLSSLSAKKGDVVYVVNAGQSYYYDGSSWKALATIAHQGTTDEMNAFSSEAAVGDVWFNTDDNKFYRWNGSSWVFIATKSHSQLDDLDADDHPQYLNDARHSTVIHTSSLLAKGVQPFNSNIRFSPDSTYPTSRVSWTSGTIKFADGSTQSINAGSTSDLSLNTTYYIYFTVGSADLSYTSTYSNAIGDDKGLLAVVGRGSDSEQEVFIQPFYSKGMNIQADMIAANAILSNHIKSGAINTDKLDSGAVTADKIAAGAVTADKITSGAITTDKLDAGAVTAEKLSVDSVTADKIVANSITTEKINGLAVTTDKIADDAITSDKVATGAITASALAKGVQPFNSNIKFSPSDPPTDVEWTSGTIKFADGSTQTIYAGSSSGDLSAGTTYFVYFVVGDNYLHYTSNYATAIGPDRGILAIVLGSNTEVAIQPFYSKGLNIQADVIAANSILSNHIASGAVSADKIAAGAISADKIAAGAVTTSKLDLDRTTSDPSGDGGELWWRSDLNQLRFRTDSDTVEYIPKFPVDTSDKSVGMTRSQSFSWTSTYIVYADDYTSYSWTISSVSYLRVISGFVGFSLASANDATDAPAELLVIWHDGSNSRTVARTVIRDWISTGEWVGLTFTDFLSSGNQGSIQAKIVNLDVNNDIQVQFACDVKEIRQHYHQVS